MRTHVPLRSSVDTSSKFSEIPLEIDELSSKLKWTEIDVGGSGGKRAGARRGTGSRGGGRRLSDGLELELELLLQSPAAPYLR